MEGFKLTSPNHYYITQSNLRALVFRAGLVEQELSDLYETTRALSLERYLSEKEIRNLNFLSSFLQKSEEQLLLHATKHTKQRSNGNGAGSLLFPSGPPRYHKDQTCETLGRDFENFEIPVEILERGDAAIRDFREFAKANKKLLKEGREDVFILRLKSHFRLTADIGKVSYSNSGRSPLPSMESGLTLDELAAEIHLAAEQVESLRETKGGAEALEKYRFAPPSILLHSRILGALERQVLERKRTLISLVTDYIVRMHKPNGSVFSQQLLEVYGFEPCGICCSDDF